MKLHYSQTERGGCNYDSVFYYLMKLHYSQTSIPTLSLMERFYYLMKLHYSQTFVIYFAQASLFYYLMKLHYSQTEEGNIIRVTDVLLPYEITLFSNTKLYILRIYKRFTTL